MTASRGVVTADNSGRSFTAFKTPQSWRTAHPHRRAARMVSTASTISDAASMDHFELQTLMQHKTLTTTQGYVSMAKRLLKPVNNLFVPTIPQIGETA